MNVSRLIADAVLKFPDETALVESQGREASTSISYAALYGKVLGFVAALHDRGLRPGDRIAILMDNSIELVVTEWACLAAGFIWVSVNARTSADELSLILGDCEPKLLIVGHGHAETAASAERPGCCDLVLQRSPDWSALFDNVAACGFRPSAPRAAAPVRIRYTSGTAGKPKGAVLTRGCYDASVENVASVLRPPKASDTVLQVAPMTHASGAMLLPHVAVGARAVLQRRFDVDDLIDGATAWRATSVFLVPTMLIRLLERIGDGSALRTLTTIVYGGASMPVDRLKTGIEVLGGVFVQIYGLTESTWPVCALRHEDHLRRAAETEAQWERRLQSCGRPTSVGELRVVGANGSDAGADELGEVWVRGRNTMRGYWAGPSASNSVGNDPKGLDAAGWMHTGDVGRKDAQGYVTIVDRLHDMIVSGGFNVYPREVETALSNHPAVLESAAVGIRDAEWGETVHAEVVLRAGCDASAAALIEHCASTLPGYKKPRSIAFVDALPKNPAGKILRRSVRARANREPGSRDS